MLKYRYIIKKLDGFIKKVTQKFWIRNERGWKWGYTQKDEIILTLLENFLQREASVYSEYKRRDSRCMSIITSNNHKMRRCSMSQLEIKTMLFNKASIDSMSGYYTGFIGPLLNNIS